jgi:translocator protein
MIAASASSASAATWMCKCGVRGIHDEATGAGVNDMRDTLTWRPILIAAAAVLLVATAGGLLTDIGPWYRGLKKPSWQPPDWLFGPVWTLIFGLTATSGLVAWHRAPDIASRQRIVMLFALNGVLNVGWTVLFFQLKRPDWALIEVVLLWFSALNLIVATSRFSSRAAWLLAPYLAWVAFAGFLNWSLVRLNGPF